MEVRANVRAKQARVRRFLGPAAALAMLLGASSAGAQSPPAEPSLPGLEAVLANLRAGGLVIYLRHAETDQTGAVDEAADMARCETQRNLSPAGREQARAIGRAVNSLGIKIGAVVSSPYCRCQDTAKLAFGRGTVSNELYFAVNTPPEQTKRITESLRQMLATAPAAGSNTVLVSHTANLREAAGIWPKPEGVAFVFKPLPDGGFQPLAKVLPQDWALAVAARK